MRTLWIALALVTVPLAGCFTPGFDGPLDAADAHAPVLVMDLPVHVVAVGFEEFDQARLLSHMEPLLPVFNHARAFFTAAVDVEPLQYDVRYVTHEAPEPFARALFEHAASIARPERPNPFLEEYDREGENRICPDTGPAPLALLGLTGSGTGPAPLELPGPAGSGEPCKDVQSISATAMERWIAKNRADHGLEFPGAGYTVFVLDHHTRGYLPTDTYHQYFLDHPAGTWANTDKARAFGGNHDFVFLDVSAGPNAYDFRPWYQWSREGVQLTQLEDRPVWDHVDDLEPFYENLARNIRDAARLLWARSPIITLDHADRYVLPIHVFIDPNARTNPDSPLHAIDPADIPANTREEVFTQALAELVPWADVEVEIHYTYLPHDDPGMHEAVQDAKTRYWAGSVDPGVIQRYLKENWDRYVPDVPDARVYPTFVLWTEFPSALQFGIATADAWGDPHFAYVNMVDAWVCLRPDVPVCTGENEPYWSHDWWRFWHFLILHEVGHVFGLHHPFSTSGVDGHGLATIEINWLWDSTATVVAYRQENLRFSSFDKEFILRGHTGQLAADVLKDPQASQAARDAAGRALALVAAGDYLDALEAAREARKAKGETGPLLPRALPHAGRGESVAYRVDVPAGESVGVPPTYTPGVPWGIPLFTGQLSRAAFPVDIPEGAVALEIEYEEADAPSHAGWYSFILVLNADGLFVLVLGSNAHGKQVLRALDHCEGGCTGVVYSYSGAAMTYEITLTPLFPAGSEASR